MSRLLTSLDAPPSGRALPVWFDAATYGRARLLGGGDVPWPSPAELSSFFAKIGGMFEILISERAGCLSHVSAGARS